MRIIKKIPFSEYRKLPGLNVTSFGEFLRSPSHYYYNFNNKKETKSLTFGRAFHEIILEPAEFQKNFIVEQDGIDRRTKEGKILYGEFLERAHGKDILTKNEHETLIEMALTVNNNPTARKLLQGQHEISCQFELEGVACKARADVLFGEDFIVDFKTTDDASSENFIRSIYNYAYYRQAAFYLHAFDRREFIIAAIEKEPPYGIAFYQMPKEMLEYGLEECKRLVTEIKACWDKNEFPGYSKQIELIETPNWMLEKIKQRSGVCQTH
jgi:hypothetical protein